MGGVDWGEDNSAIINNVVGGQSHRYENPGTYTVRRSGDSTGIYLDNQHPTRPN